VPWTGQRAAERGVDRVSDVHRRRMAHKALLPGVEGSPAVEAGTRRDSWRVAAVVGARLPGGRTSRVWTDRWERGSNGCRFTRSGDGRSDLAGSMSMGFGHACVFAMAIAAASPGVAGAHGDATSAQAQHGSRGHASTPGGASQDGRRSPKPSAPGLEWSKFRRGRTNSLGPLDLGRGSVELFGGRWTLGWRGFSLLDGCYGLDARTCPRGGDAGLDVSLHHRRTPWLQFFARVSASAFAVEDAHAVAVTGLAGIRTAIPWLLGSPSRPRARSF
jgi:hypothetical protein